MRNVSCSYQADSGAFCSINFCALNSVENSAGIFGLDGGIVGENLLFAAGPHYQSGGNVGRCRKHFWCSSAFPPILRGLLQDIHTTNPLNMAV
jgi:hypothetical protein